MVKAVIFDFGGVLAEEGFREGLKVIAENNQLDAEVFFRIAANLICETGYVTGAASDGGNGTAKTGGENDNGTYAIR
jgi:putative hydrolase of the HAD superfamily